MPGGAKPLHRGHLTSLGPFHEVSCDGRDKLGALAPDGRRHPHLWHEGQVEPLDSSSCRSPNNRLATTIGHVYLDFVNKYEGESQKHTSMLSLTEIQVLTAVPMQIMVDKGSETPYTRAFQKRLG
jgi:hypothetical protein